MKSGSRVPLFAALVLLVALSGCSAMGSRDPGSRSERAATIEAPAGDATVPVELQPAIPPVAQAAWSRAEAAISGENWAAAENALAELILDFPEYVGPHINLAIVYRNTDRLVDAAAVLQVALGLEPSHPAANNELGMLLRQRGEFDAAETAYRRALAADPDYGFAHYNLGVLLDLYLHRRAEAIQHYEAYQALLPEPDSQVGFWIADLRRRLGTAEEPIQVAMETGE